MNRDLRYDLLRFLAWLNGEGQVSLVDIGEVCAEELSWQQSKDLVERYLETIGERSTFAE